MLRIVVMLCLFAFLIPCWAQVPASNIDSIFSYWNNDSTPGGAVGVIKDGNLVFAKGYGLADLEHDLPITPATVFYMASSGKQFTAFAILLLEEQGKLNLEDEIQQYLPDFPRFQQPITIRHLVHHTSGIRDYSSLWDLQGRGYLERITAKETYRLIKDQSALNFAPGERSVYSNSGYFLLSEIVAKTSGQSLKSFAEEHIFQPLGMSSTLFLDDNREIIKGRAHGYQKMENEDGFGNIIRRFELVGSGGVYSSIEDLARWDQNFYDNRLGKGSTNIINKMYRVGLLNNGEATNRAFGLVAGTHKGIKVMSHGGSHGGYKAELLRFPEKRLSVILLSNRSDVNPTRESYRVADLFLPDITAANIEQSGLDTSKPGLELSAEELRRISGDYINKKSGSVRKIVVEDNVPYYYRSASRQDKLVPISKNILQMADTPGPTVTLRFGDDNGVPTLSYYSDERHVSTRHRFAPKSYRPEDLKQFEGAYFCADLQVSYRLQAEGESISVILNHEQLTVLTGLTTDLLSNPGFGVFDFERNAIEEITGFTLNSARVWNLRFDKQ